MLDKIQRQSRIVEQLARNSMTGDVTNTDDWPGGSEEDGMGVKIGDEIHNHYEQPRTPAQPAPAQPSSKASGLATAALVAAGLLGGGGVGAAVPWLLGAYDQTPATNTTIDKTQDMGVGVEVVPGGAVDNSESGDQ